MTTAAAAGRRTRARATPDPDVRRLEVDGVPVFFADRSGPLRAGLTFRVGQADERVQQRGVTHLVEHMALSEAGLPLHAYNGSTGRTFTTFVCAGSGRETVDHLRDLCSALSDLPESRFEHERGVLRAEAAGRGRPSLPLWRWGPKGYGLVGYEETGLDGLDIGAVRAWAGRHFHRGNAALWLSGPAPRGLSLPLPGGDGALLPPPDPHDAVLDLPAWYACSPDYTSLSYLVPRSASALLAGAVLGSRLERRLRHELGLVYSVIASSDRLTSEVAEHTFATAGSGAETGVRVAEETCRVLTELRERPITRQELSEVLRGVDLSDATELSSVLSRVESRAQAHLLGQPEPSSYEQYLAELRAVRPAQVSATLQEALSNVLIAAPPGSDIPEDLARPAPLWSTTELTGTSIVASRARQGGFDRLILADSGLSATTEDGNAVTIRYDQVAAVTPFTDGSRILLAEDGLLLRLFQEDWPKFGRVRQAVDAALPEHLFLASVERQADPDVARRLRRQRIVQAGSAVGGAAAAAVALALPGSLPGLGPAVAGVVLGVLAWINVGTLRFPDKLVAVGAAAAAAGLIGDAIALGSPSPLLAGATGAAASFATMFAALFAKPTWFGYGTVKASTIVGLGTAPLGVVAWTTSTVVLIASLLVGAVIASLRSRGDLATGPTLVLGLTSGLVAAALR